MDRRGFLKTAALTAGVAAAAPRATAQDRIRCALLGVDHSHGADVLQVLQGLPEYEVVGVCEPDDAIQQRFKDDPEWKDVRWLTRDELLGDESIRMVAIESGVPRLLELGRAAARTRG